MFEYAEARIVLFPLAIEASDSALGFVDAILDDPSTDDLALVDRERREDDSEGAGRGFVAISLLWARRRFDRVRAGYSRGIGYSPAGVQEATWLCLAVSNACSDLAASVTTSI